jgi:multidrug resistance efflux pump
MILPHEYIKNSIETYIYQHPTHSQKIYWVVLLVITVTLVSLPFIYVDISVQGNGVVRPIAEKTEITASITELVDSVFVHEGAKVKRGDVILRFRTNSSDYKIHYQTNRLNDYAAHLADLIYLAKGERPTVFRSAVRQQEYTYFMKRRKKLQTSVVQAEKEYRRNKVLFDEKLISEEEYEKYFYDYENDKNELASFVEGQISTWQSDLNNYRNSQNEMNSSMNQDVKGQDLYVVRSPVSGTVDQFSGIYRGSSVQAGQSLAIISPDSTMYFEVYVIPRNIGYLRVGMPVNVQVESFNYNEWGMIQGRVTDISSDFLTNSQGDSYYKVKCSMDRDYLELKNGRKGKLKKGMTIGARFIITRKSLFNLLYQKLDDWVNPTQYKNEATLTTNG